MQICVIKSPLKLFYVSYFHFQVGSFFDKTTFVKTDYKAIIAMILQDKDWVKLVKSVSMEHQKLAF